MNAKIALGLTLAAVVIAYPERARAFAHIVQPGETLAMIAERVYGDPKREVVLVGANALDAQGGTVIATGMRLEIPAPGHHTVLQGETWGAMSLSWLGSKDIARIDLLALSNHGLPWVAPVEGREIEIPAVITYIAGDSESVDGIAQRFWGDHNRGWELNRYNQREGFFVKRGEVVLVPMPGLKLTEEGKADARAAAERDGASGGLTLERQRQADLDLPQLLADIRYGRYVDAIARGNRVLGAGALTRPQLAAVHRAMLEAYVALDARALAATACADWQANEPGAALGDPVHVSPKIRAACPVP
jgi:hypothetical protein